MTFIHSWRAYEMCVSCKPDSISVHHSRTRKPSGRRIMPIMGNIQIVIRVHPESPPCLMAQGLPGFPASFPLEAHRQNPFENVATSLAFGMAFRDFRLFCFGSHEKCTQNALRKASFNAIKHSVTALLCIWQIGKVSCVRNSP